MIHSPEIQAKIAIWRAKNADGTITIAEMREAVEVMRAGRVSAAYSGAKAAAKAKARVPTAEELLNDMEGL